LEKKSMSRVLLPFLLIALSSLFAPRGAAAQDAKPHKEDGPFKHLKLRLVGPAAGGRVSGAAGVPNDPMTYYLGAASGGVWKTTDGGIHWKPIFDDQPTASIGALAVSVSDPNVIYVGSGEANIRGNVSLGLGIFKSTNAGKSWKHVWKQKGQIGHIVIHPTNPDIAFAAVLGSAFGPNPERGVYRTTDGGATWKQVLAKKAPSEVDGKNLEDVGAIDVAFDPNNPRILFAALWQARRTPWSLTSGGPGCGLFRSEDGGDTWKKLGPTKFVPLGMSKDDDKIDKDKQPKKKPAVDDEEDNGLPAGIWGRVGVAVAPSDSSRVYALIEAEKGGLYRSDDGGESWESVNEHRYLQQRPWYFSVIRVDPKNADIVYVSNVRLLKSSDGGKSFKNLKGPHHVDHHDLWIDPNNPARILDSNDGGVDITLNGGATWHAPMLPISQFYHVAADTSVPYRVMGNMQDLGTASGPSNSLKSGGIMLSEWHSVGGGETGMAVPDPSDPNIVYAGEYMGIITKYDLRTRQARNISIYPVTSSGKGAEELRYRFQWTAPILISPHESKTVYHGANVLLRTRDAGKTWEKISPDLSRDDKSKQKWTGGPITGDNTGAETYCTIFALAESPAKKGVLWAGSDDGLVHISSDDGKTWANVTANIPGIPKWGTVACIEPSHKDPGTAYVVVDAHRLDDDKPYLWKTADFGKTWTSLTAALPKDDYLRVARVDPTTPGLLYLGSEHGLSISWDDGKTWRKLKLNFPTVAVCDLVVKGNDLVVGTNGRSIWILDDLTPLREWSDKLKDKTHFFSVRPAIRWRYSSTGYAPDDRISGDNPPAGAVLQYHLPHKVKEEDLRLEILDDKGVLVRKMTGKKPKSTESADSPDAPWSIYKPTVLPHETGIQRVTWDLRNDGPTVIPGAKSDWGVPHEGFLVPPGTYTLKLTVEGETFVQKVDVTLDPRTKAAVEDLEAVLAANHQRALQVRDDITSLSKIVIALQSVRKQLKTQVGRLEKAKDTKDAKTLIADAKALLKKLDHIEDMLHNPKAEVAYDILAMKGGAKLYSQLSALYSFMTESDGIVTQGMREAYADWSKELKAAQADWHAAVASLARLNAALREIGTPHVVAPMTAVPPAKSIGPE